MAEDPKIKISLYGDQEVGKTSFIKRYIDGEFTHVYVETIGVAFREKEITIQDQKVTISLWDIGGSDGYQVMIPLCANDANAFLLLFDLTNLQSLLNLRKWYKNVRRLNDGAFILLVGTKYEKFEKLDMEQKQQTVEVARKYAAKMGAPLIFTSAQAGINIFRCIKQALSMIFGFPSDIEKQTDINQPLFEYEDEEGVE